MTETEKRAHSVCFTGHRPEKLHQPENIIREDLEQEIRRALTDGLYIFITGMARGVDIWAAQSIIRLRSTQPLIKLVCACPYAGFEKGWTREWQRQYQEILASADLVRYIRSEYSRSCFQIRNRWMVDHAARVIAVFNGENGGTKNTIDYALKKEVPVIYIPG